jgi:hypothetical protein
MKWIITLVKKYDPNNRNVLLDEFLTPTELVKACFEQAIYPLLGCMGGPYTILDVGANDGRWGKMARSYLPDARIVGVEIMEGMSRPEEFDEWHTIDFMLFRPTYRFDLIVGNPPFTVKEPNGTNKEGKPKYKTKYKAETFVRHGLDLLTETGLLAFLLRSNMRHSVERYWLDKQNRVPGLWQTNQAMHVWNCTLRGSFYREDPRTKQFGTKQTNAHDYAMFVWSKQWLNSYYIGRQLDWEYRE